MDVLSDRLAKRKLSQHQCVLTVPDAPPRRSAPRDYADRNETLDFFLLFSSSLLSSPNILSIIQHIHTHTDISFYKTVLPGNLAQ